MECCAGSYGSWCTLLFRLPEAGSLCQRLGDAGILVRGCRGIAGTKAASRANLVFRVGLANKIKRYGLNEAS